MKKFMVMLALAAFCAQAQAVDEVITKSDMLHEEAAASRDQNIHGDLMHGAMHMAEFIGASAIHAAQTIQQDPVATHLVEQVVVTTGGIVHDILHAIETAPAFDPALAVPTTPDVQAPAAPVEEPTTSSLNPVTSDTNLENQIPAVEEPSVPAVDPTTVVPTTPDAQAPAIPAVDEPSMPAVDSVIPENQTPALEEPNVPAVDPTAVTPTTPDVQAPAIPAVDEPSVSALNSVTPDTNLQSQVPSLEEPSVTSIPAQEVTAPIHLLPLKALCPSIRINLRYASSKNFTDQQIYPSSADCYVTPEVARRLKLVQHELQAKGYSLMIWDAYQPHEEQQKLRNAMTYKNNTSHKDIMVSDAHRKGMAVDVTLCKSKSGKHISMPTDFGDCSAKAHPTCGNLSKRTCAHRNLLCSLMSKYGFEQDNQVWWNFKLQGWQEAPACAHSFEELKTSLVE